MTYAAIDAVLALGPDVSPTERCILVALARRVDQDGCAWPSRESLAADAGVSRATVTRMRASMVKAGLIERVESSDLCSSSLGRWLSIPPALRPAIYRLTVEGAQAEQGSRERAPQRAQSEQGAHQEQGGGSPGTPEGAHRRAPNPQVTPSEPPTLSCDVEQATLIDIDTDARPGAERVTDAQFAEFWQAYPKKRGGPKGAEAKYRSARKAGVTHEQIMAGVAAYRAEIASKRTEDQYIAYATTWLNQGRWADEYDPPSDQQERPKSQVDLDAEAAASMPSLEERRRLRAERGFDPATATWVNR